MTGSNMREGVSTQVLQLELSPRDLKDLEESRVVSCFCKVGVQNLLLRLVKEGVPDAPVPPDVRVRMDDTHE